MKKVGLMILLAGAVIFSAQNAFAIDVNMMGGVGGIGAEAGLMRNHDIQMINQRRFEFEKSREYQAEQRAKQQEEELKAKFQQYESQKERLSNPQSNMEFMQSPSGSIIIRQGQTQQ